jgi:glutamine---fructose-6-phosphate transaminase (isomerizing)
VHRKQSLRCFCNLQIVCGVVIGITTAINVRIMCGIFGYVGEKQAQDILLGGLRMLEYRGYDSAGIYVAGTGVVKAVGKVQSLAEKISKHPLTGTVGIAHTRWATHGAPTEVNAHPHHDTHKMVWVVHNGIIENFQEIKETLAMQGITCSSQTDTEVLTKLIGTFYRHDIAAAVTEALRLVRGTYGLAVIGESETEKIVVARMGSPIVIGVGADEHFVASDPSALLPHTSKVVYLDDGEIAEVYRDNYVVRSFEGVTKEKASETITWDVQSVQKNGYDHFMLKEIFEAPEVIRNTIRGRVQIAEGKVKLGGLESLLPKLAALERLYIVGCGSAYYAGLVTRLMIETYARIPVEVELGSEYRYKQQFPLTKSALLAITQSGETADTLASVRLAKSLGIPTLGMVNVVGSTIARETDAGVYNHAGPEIAVASTKAFISQLTVSVLLTVFLARERGMSEVEASEILESLTALPDKINTVLQQASHIEALAKKCAHYEHMMYIGRQFLAPIAYEGALKLKEVSYVHAEAFAGGELKHGSIALLGPTFPVVAIVADDAVREKMLSNIEEVKARHAPVIVVVTEGDKAVSALADDSINIPSVHPLLQPIIASVPLQLFAYYMGTARGHDVDQPRNLAKSVTVE